MFILKKIVKNGTEEQINLLHSEFSKCSSMVIFTLLIINK